MVTYILLSNLNKALSDAAYVKVVFSNVYTSIYDIILSDVGYIKVVLAICIQGYIILSIVAHACKYTGFFMGSMRTTLSIPKQID